MTIIQKSIAGVFLILLLSACTRDRPAPEAIVLPDPQENVVLQGGNNAAPEPAPNGQGDSQSTSQGEGAAPAVVQATPVPVVEPGVQQPTAVVVVPPLQEQVGNQTIQYTVKSGDTLFSIADNYGVSVDVLQQLNYLQGGNLQANQVLRIPLLEGFTTEGRPTATPQPLIHVVESGETLYGIAVQYGVDPTSIIAANNITDQDGIYVGQGLRIPGYAASPSAGVTQVEPTQEVLVIDPSNSTGSPAVTTSGVPVAANTVQVIHIVQPGEGLYEIAINYDVSPVDIATANNIQNYELLRVGQQLFIPGVAADAGPVVANQAASQQVHIVQAGEGLLEIAVRYGVTSESISAANNIADSDLIYPGQQLTIPSP